MTLRPPEKNARFYSATEYSLSLFCGLKRKEDRIIRIIGNLRPVDKRPYLTQYIQDLEVEDDKKCEEKVTGIETCQKSKRILAWINEDLNVSG